MRTPLVALLILLFSFVLGAQESFYKKGRATTSRLKIITKEGVNPHYSFTVINGSSGINLGPEDVDAYKKNYGNVYITREVDAGHLAFLETLVTGTLSLYYLKDRNLESRFFLKRTDGTFIEMTNDKRKANYFHKIIKKEWQGCERLDRYIKETTFTRASVTRIIKSHNLCERMINPRTSHTFFGGLGFTKYVIADSRNVKSVVPPGLLREGVYKRELSYFLGYNMEVPIQSTNTSVFTGLRLHKIGVNYVTVFGFGETVYRIDANTVDLGVPLGIMHNTLIANLQTFFSFEFIPTYQIYNDVTVTFIVSEPRGVTTSTSDFTTAKFAVNGNAGIGIKIPTKEGKEIYAKLGYDLRLGTGNRRLFNVSTPYILVGYSL